MLLSYLSLFFYDEVWKADLVCQADVLLITAVVKAVNTNYLVFSILCCKEWEEFVPVFITVARCIPGDK